jgi:hypothetical protein
VKPIPIARLAEEGGGEYVLGMKDLHTGTCYLLYGSLHPGETHREVRPGPGHEEILCAVDGPLTMHTIRGDVMLEPGHAILVKEDESFFLSNPSHQTVCYIAAGGRRRPDG